MTGTILVIVIVGIVIVLIAAWIVAVVRPRTY